MNDDIDMYLSEPLPGSYLESLVRSRAFLKDSPTLLAKLDEVISEELWLALTGSQKAKSEILKKTEPKTTVRPIK